MRRDAPENLHLPEGQNYDCLQCGDSCHIFWEIPVDAESERAMIALGAAEYLQRKPERGAFEASAFDSSKRVLCKATDGACVFLNGENLCALHAAKGPEAKPQACRDFPFRYVDTSNGEYVGVSFACTAVLKNHGTPVADQAAPLAESYRESLHVRATETRPALTGRISIDFEAYLEIEQALDEILALPNLAIGQRLLCQSILMDVIVRAFQAARHPDATTASLSVEEQQSAASANDCDIARGAVDLFRRDKWGRLILMAMKRGDAPALQRAFLGLATTFRQALGQRTNRARALLAIAKHYASHAMKMGKVRLDPLDKRFSYNRFRTDWIAPKPGTEADALLTRYFQHALFRKDLLLAETLVSGHRFQLMNFALTNWYAVGSRANAAETPSDLEAYEQAIRNVELFYAHHSLFTQFLENQPVLGTLVDSVLHNPRFAAAMTGKPVK